MVLKNLVLRLRLKTTAIPFNQLNWNIGITECWSNGFGGILSIYTYTRQDVCSFGIRVVHSEA
jgi:hypothetical protein